MSVSKVPVALQLISMAFGSWVDESAHSATHCTVCRQDKYSHSIEQDLRAGPHTHTHTHKHMCRAKMIALTLTHRRQLTYLIRISSPQSVSPLGPVGLLTVRPLQQTLPSFDSTLDPTYTPNQHTIRCSCRYCSTLRCSPLAPPYSRLLTWPRCSPPRQFHSNLMVK